MAAAEDTLIHEQIDLAAADDGQAEKGLYDSAARQRVPVLLVVDGEEFEVILVIEPVGDTALTRYAKACGGVAEEEDGEEALVSRLRTSFNATTVLFDAVVADIEGVGDEGEARPENWREFFSPHEKSEFVQDVVFGYEYVEPKKAAKGKRPRWGADLSNMTTRVKFPFEGGMVETFHTLKKADAKAYGEYMALMSRTDSIRGVDAHLLQLAAWYDEHHVSHQGYKGDVPRHHRATAYVLHMTRQRAAVRKN